MPAQLVFRTAAGSRGPATNATPRTPPCHSVHFEPRSGQLLPASRYLPLLVAPPLSVVTTRMVSGHMFAACRALTT